MIKLLKQYISKYGGVDEPTLDISPQGLQHPRNTYFVLALPQIALHALSLGTHFWKDIPVEPLPFRPCLATG
jgi:hypothetical protein